MKPLLILGLTVLLPFISLSQNLKISKDGHRLTYQNGSAFFYMADTAWELFHRCSEKETEMYFKDRKSKGFNVIQAVVLAELDGLNTPNAAGEVPFKDLNTLTPNEAYFKQIDRIIEKAEENGLYLALLPTWGDKWNKKWGVGPVIFDTPEKAFKYGKWLGKRYKNQPNIIWIMGGDRNPENKLHFKINRAMAKGIQEGDGENHLMSYHPGGGVSSSDWFAHDQWLDFNMLQTGHSTINHLVYIEIGRDYNMVPVKPCINGEPQYEDIPVKFTSINERFTAYDVRQAAYWSVLAGASGHTYGNNNIWQMWTPDKKPEISARIPWYKAINQPGATQMGYMRKLFESRPFLNMIPDQNILTEVFGQDKTQIRAARGNDYSFVIVYSPKGNPIHLNLKNIYAKKLKGYWYNPREGQSHELEAFNNTKKVKVFVPPSSGLRTDWVLVLDDVSKNYPDPVSINLK